MFSMLDRTTAIVLALLGPAAFLAIRHALRKITHLGTDTVVVITGASSGIGKACAVEFFRLGCSVVLCSRRMEKLQEVKDELLSMRNLNQNFNEPAIVQLDIADAKSVKAAVEEIAWKFPGGINIIVNNAGISFRGEIVSTTMEVHRKVMETNYFGQVAFTKGLLPSMLKLPSEQGRTKAHILSINSIQGKISIPHRSAYSASKFACQAFFDCLRSEVAGSGIRVCSVYPAYVKTDISLNAVRGDGTGYGKMDASTQSGMSPVHVALEIVKAVRFNKEEVVLPDTKSRIAIFLRFLAPFFYFWVMKQRAKKKVD